MSHILQEEIPIGSWFEWERIRRRNFNGEQGELCSDFSETEEEKELEEIEEKKSYEALQISDKSLYEKDMPIKFKSP